MKSNTVEIGLLFLVRNKRSVVVFLQAMIGNVGTQILFKRYGLLM